ncbi:MAG: DNA polymerase IV [Verrucomicrobia bacterium]|nr:DNA polymerase IV [Verrucomicrobiota bacterium]MCH8512484.1 DNA polymerase IV [Kiritimatiellia bacterium]
MNAPTTILHVDMDAFFASVEQRDRPELRGKPVIVGGDPTKRGVVAAASYEARKFGVHSAMPTREAHRRCPDAIFVRGRMNVYKSVSRQVFAIFEDVTPMVQPVSVDEAFLDVTGALHLWGNDPVRIAEHIRTRIRKEVQLTASVGIAPNKFLAKLASDMNKPDGYTVVPRDAEAIRAFLAPLPVGRIWGVGKKTGDKLAGHGIHTIRDLQAANPKELTAWFGEHAARHLLALSQGLDDRPVHDREPEKSMSSEHTFGEDQTDPTVWRRILLEQSEEVGRRLRKAGLWSGCIHLKVRNDKFQTRTRQQTLAVPTRQDLEIYHAALALLEKTAPDRPIRLLGVGASHLTDTPVIPGPAQLDLFADTPPAQASDPAVLDRVIDQLRERYGDKAVQRAALARKPEEKE